MTKQELEEKKEELRNLLKDADTEEKVSEIEEKLRSLSEEKIEETDKGINKSGEISHEEERSLLREVSNNLEERNLKDVKVIEKPKGEERKMEKLTIASAEYRSAWAKKLMGLKEEKFTEEEKRALGDAITTTATTFVESDASTQGINNGGLFIPSTVREELLEIITKQSPIFRDIRKLQVAGNIDLPYLFEADESEWYAELTDTKNEGQEYKNLQLTGWELAKDIVITWKLEEMAVESFIAFILEELSNKMGKALVNAIIYGDGSNKPTGITNGLTPISTGATPIDTIIDTFKSLDEDSRIGAKAYISSNVNISIVGYKDSNGNYPFLNGVATNKLVSIEQDPYLKNNDIVVGNCKNYILNEVTSLRVDREKTIKGRKTTYGGYAVYDGKPKPNAFAYGQHTTGEISG